MQLARRIPVVDMGRHQSVSAEYGLRHAYQVKIHSTPLGKRREPPFEIGGSPTDRRIQNVEAGAIQHLEHMFKDAAETGKSTNFIKWVAKNYIGSAKGPQLSYTIRCHSLIENTIRPNAVR